MTFTEAVGALIEELRGDMSQADLADKSGVSQSTISAIEKGNRTFRGVHVEDILRATNTDGVAAVRMLRVVAERLQETPPRPTKRRGGKVEVAPQVARLDGAARERSVSSTSAVVAVTPATSKPGRTPRRP